MPKLLPNVPETGAMGAKMPKLLPNVSETGAMGAKMPKLLPNALGRMKMCKNEG